MVDLSGQVALVTGGSRGLGLLLARELAREGCRVVICARDGQELERARAELARGGADVLALPCDVSDRGSVEQLVEQTVQRLGRLDLLVANAGVIQVGPAPTMTVEDFEDALGVMFWGVVYPTLAALPHLRGVGGRVVTITSIGGKVSSPHLLPYNCAKFAAVGFSEGLTAELARDGVRVTTVVPGLMRTGSPLNAFFKGRAEREFAWFTLGDSVPGVSMDAERAARRIVAAAKRGTPEVILTVPAKVAVRAHGLAPATTIRLLGVVNRMLPDPDPATRTATRGAEAYDRVRMPGFACMVRSTLTAARRFNQRPGPTEVLPIRTAADQQADRSR